MIQYGALQLLSKETMKRVTGLVSKWWVKKHIHEPLRNVEIISLHKKGDRLSLSNKRGIGLVSKLILIMEMVLFNRLTECLAKAKTRSRAQGGATPGVSTMDVLYTLVMVIAHAYRSKKLLWLVEYDFFKFFDTIPGRAFIDALRFFGFGEDVIAIARLFWEGFTAWARTKFGRTGRFPVKLGNIQGLGGSPGRSAWVMDLFLCWLESTGLGYKFKSFNKDFPECDLDCTLLVIAAIAWLDDCWTMGESVEELRVIHNMFQSFANYYSLRFVPDKCHIYFVKSTSPETAPDPISPLFHIVDFNNNRGFMQVVEPEDAFRCLGAWFNMKLDWKQHGIHLKSALKDFGERLSLRHSPPVLTAKLVNSNGLPKTTYALPIAELSEKELQYLQGLLIKPVKTDGYHSYLVPYKAYTMPIEEGGYGVTSLAAVYKGTKVMGLYRALNSAYHQARITTRMTLLDLQRVTKSPDFPLSSNFEVKKPKRSQNFPQLLFSCSTILKACNMEIFPRQWWDVSKISIRSLVNCVGREKVPSRIINILEAAGFGYAWQVSPIFAPNSEIGGFSPILLAIREARKSNTLTFNSCINTSISELKGVGPLLSLDLKRGVWSAVMRILDGDDAFRFCAMPTLEDEWFWRHFSNEIKASSTLTPLLGSDGSKRFSTAFSVINADLKTVFASTIPGRATSQRAEAFGLLAMSILANADSVITSDAKYIVDAINKGLGDGLTEKDWKTINNRSIIRATIFIARKKKLTLKWVKGHQQEPHTIEGKINKAADRQARVTANTSDRPLVSELFHLSDEYYALHKGLLFEGDIRKRVYNSSISLEIDTYKASIHGE